MYIKKIKKATSLILIILEILSSKQIFKINAKNSPPISISENTKKYKNWYDVEYDSINDAKDIIPYIVWLLHDESIIIKALNRTGMSQFELARDNILKAINIQYLDYISKNLYSVIPVKKYLVLKKYKISYNKKELQNLNFIIYKLVCGYLNYVKYSRQNKNKVRQENINKYKINEDKINKALKQLRYNLKNLPYELNQNIIKIFGTFRIKI